MEDLFIKNSIVQGTEKLGELLGEFPIRNFDLIEFYEQIKEKHNIVLISFDVENHIISFQTDDKKLKVVEQ